MDPKKKLAQIRKILELPEDAPVADIAAVLTELDAEVSSETAGPRAARRAQVAKLNARQSLLYNQLRNAKVPHDKAMTKALGFKPRAAAKPRASASRS